MGDLREPQEIIKDSFNILGWIVLAVVVLAPTVGAGGFYAGYRYGRSHCEPVSSVKPGDSCPIRRHGSAVERMHKRNLVWRAMNKESLSPSPEARLGRALALIIAPGYALDDRLEGVEDYFNKSNLYATPDEIMRYTEIMGFGSGEARLKVLRSVVDFDSRAAALIGEILADDARMGALIAGQPIELEKLPDGTVP